MFLPAQVYTGQENLNTENNLPHPKQGLSNVLSTATESGEKKNENRSTHSSRVGDRGLKKGFAFGNSPLKQADFPTFTEEGWDGAHILEGSLLRTF